jgi:SagB-type dehydrogenase family enzyme
MSALNKRRSARSFSSRELPVEVLSDLLWAAYGVNRPDEGLRTAPSARNMQEIDIYVAMKDGLYLYDPARHALEPVLPGDIREFTGKQDFTQAAPVNLIYVADSSRMSGDEQSDGFYAAVDTGFISQNVYLFCASEGLSTVVLGWVDKERLAGKMGLPGEKKVILTQPVGYPAGGPPRYTSSPTPGPGTTPQEGPRMMRTPTGGPGRR